MALQKSFCLPQPGYFDLTLSEGHNALNQSDRISPIE